MTSPPQYEAGLVVWDGSGKRYYESVKIVDPSMRLPAMTLVAKNLTRRLPGIDIVAYLPFCHHAADGAFNPERSQALPWRGVDEMAVDVAVSGCG